MIAAEPRAMPSWPRRPRSSRPSTEPPPTSSSCQIAEAARAPSANSATAVPVGLASALRPRTTAAKVITVAGLTAVMPIRVR